VLLILICRIRLTGLPAIQYFSFPRARQYLFASRANADSARAAAFVANAAA
jgi:hypothetical protein